MLNANTAKNLDVCHRLENREAITPAIVHLGLGAFHRGHQALITDEFMALSGQRNWGIIAANLLGGQQLVDDLKSQDCLYTVTETNPDGSRNHKLVSSIVDVIFAEHDRRSLIEDMARESTRIVTLTITEKGYFTDHATGKLLLNDPVIAHDLAHPDHPRSALGIIVAALAKRRNAGLPPFTVMSCDNMPENGRRTHNAVLQYAARIDHELSHWIDDQCTFPGTVVDRIVPSTTQQDLEYVRRHLGVDDKGAISCEAFRQWVIEDNFVMGRPDWDDAPGVIFVDDVQPYEEMKLRMLNGSHSFLAYLGYLGGFPTISEASSDPDFYAATRSLMLDVAATTLDMPEGTDLNAYAEQLLDRFQTPGLGHRTSQVAIDGSRKIPRRWLNTIRWHLKKSNGSSAATLAPLALALAAWIKYVSAEDERGHHIDVHDPMAGELKLISSLHSDDLEDCVREFLSVTAIFDMDLSSDERFIAQVIDAAHLLDKKGARAAVAQLTA